jgi:hypothetical protein
MDIKPVSNQRDTYDMKPELNEEFTRWYERFFLQSPRLASLQYDDEKMWEAWKAGYKEGVKDGNTGR